MGQALNLSGKHSTIVLFGLPSADAKLEIPVLETLTKEKTIRFSWLAPLVWPKVIHTLASCQITLDDLITHRFNLEDLVTALEMLHAKEEPMVKAIVIF